MNFHTRAHRLLATTAAALLLLTAIAVCAVAQDAPEPVTAPMNPAFLIHTQTASQVQTSIDHPMGLIPEPFDQTGINRVRVGALGVVALPASYDLRSQNKLTPIRDQGSCGSCWSFATMGSLESSLMPTESWDFSENNLKNLSGYSLGCCNGGNRAMSTAYLTRWAGPIAETDDPYNASGCSSPSGLSPKKHVQDVIFVQARSGSLDNNAIKQAVMTYGAVYTTYYHSNGSFNSSNSAYYYSGSSQANHAVCVVGWDDNYAASKFTVAPPGNGAFLMRNSWGTYWGNSGYFWMSYYDAVMGKTENAVFRAEPTTNYDSIYQYDALGWVSNSGYGSNTAWFANVFTATANSSVAAAAWYAPAANSSYTLNVYTNPSSGPIGTSGPLATVSGTMATAGYHTVQLPSLVPVTAGQKFSVVVQLTTPGYSYPICLEMPYAGYSAAATASAGQSYMSSNGTSWTDVAGYYANTNVCLKAFTSNAGAPPPSPGTLSVTPSGSLVSSGSAGGPFSPASQAYTLTNAGGTSIDWTAVPSQTWIGVSSTGGTLAAGASATVTVSINANANTLAAGSYSGSVAFNNATTGSGNTTRSVSLTVNTPTPTPGALSVSPSTALAASGKTGGPFSPSSQAYSLTNTGGSAISWTTRATQPWVTVSATGGSLAAGATASVTVSINSTANGLAAGAYSDTVTFTNTTNGSGNTTRGVSLAVGSVTPPPTSGSYSAATTTYSWIDPTNHQKVPASDDSVSGGYIMPFTFTFYGKPYTTVYVGSNGLLGFASTGMYLWTNVALPSAGYPNCAIYPYWDDLNPAIRGSVRIALTGTAPNRNVVVSWVGVALESAPTTTLTFQALLCEGSNDIIFQYKDVAPTCIYGGGASATVGIENQTGTQACQFSYNTKLLSNNMALRFTQSVPTTRQPAPPMFGIW